MQTIINNDAPLKRIERLLDFELLPPNCFDNCEDELIDFVTRKVIKNQKDSRLQGLPVFGKDHINKKYFEVFKN